MPTGVYEKSIEHKQKLVAILAKVSENNKGKEHTPAHKEKISNAMKGKKNSLGKNLGNKNSLGKKHSPEANAKKGTTSKGVRNNNWKGGITPIAFQVRNSSKYAQWRTDVFIRDKFTCRKCGQIGRNLEVHHVFSFADLFQEAMEYMPLFSPYEAALLYFPLWRVENGTTLCRGCHKKERI